MSVLELYQIQPAAFDLFSKAYANLRPSKPVRSFNDLTPIQLAAITAHEAALRYFAEKDPTCFKQSDQAGFNLLHHVTVADQLQPGTLEKVKVLLEELFPHITEELMAAKCHASAAFSSRGVTPQKLMEHFQPPLSTVPFVETQGNISHMPQEEFHQKYHAHFQNARTVLSAKSVIQILWKQLKQEAVQPEEKKAESSYLPYSLKYPLDRLALRVNPHVGGLEVVATAPIRKGSLIPYFGKVVPKNRPFDFQVRRYTTKHPWENTSFQGHEWRSFASCINQGDPNCALSLAPAPDTEGIETQTSCYITTKNLKPGDVLTTCSPYGSDERFGKFFLPQETWDAIQARNPLYFERLFLHATNKKFALPVTFYFLNPAVLLYLLLQKKLSCKAWQHVQQVHQKASIVFPSLLGFSRILSKVKQTIDAAPQGMRDLFGTFLTENILSTNVIYDMLFRLPSTSFQSRPHPIAFFVAYGSLFDLFYETLNGTPFGTALNDETPQPLSPERLAKVKEETDDHLHFLEDQLRPEEKAPLIETLEHALLLLSQKGLAQLRAWRPISQYFLELHHELAPMQLIEGLSQ